MISNSNMPANPTTPNSSDPEWAAAVTGRVTKREHFAGLAMQGLMSNSNARVTCLQCAEISVSHADALLAELDRVKS
jgi:hypothetical protein